MNTREQDIRNAAVSVCTARTVEDSIKIFIEHQSLLQDCRFIFAATKGSTPGFSVNHNFSAKGVIRGLFKTDKVWVLDKVTLNEMREGYGITTFPIDYSISLDTQALSYLEPYIHGKTLDVKDFAEVFEFLARTDVNVDPMPYLLENLFKQNSQYAYDQIFFKYKSYEILRTLDLENLRVNKRISSTLSNEQLNIQTQRNLATIIHGFDNKAKEAFKLRLDSYYCLLLKMAIIHFSRPKLTVKQKMQKFLDFMDQELATIWQRELIVAYEFFKQGNNLNFFGKIQTNTPDILKEILNMSWDFFHIRQLEEAAAILLNGARYYFPSLLTFDHKFKKIIDLCPLKAYAYLGDLKQPLPFYDEDVLSAFNTFLNESDELGWRYFSSEAIASRNKRRSNLKDNLNDLIAQFELEITRHCESSKEMSVS